VAAAAAASAAASSAPAPGAFAVAAPGLVGVFVMVNGIRSERFDESLPMFQYRRRLPVNLEPGQRIVKRAAMHQ
jgi:hypothetical protein